MSEIRPMQGGDIEQASDLWRRTFADLDERQHRPAEPQTPDAGRTVETPDAGRTVARMAHLHATDPDGGWVAVDPAGAVVGLTQAMVREQLWFLSMLAVDPGMQERGVGSALLERALQSAREVPSGLIVSSADPRAMHRYVSAGFDLHPAMVGQGAVRRPPPASPAVRPGNRDDLGTAAELARALRGGSNERELGFLLGTGSRLWIHEAGGYAVASGGRLQNLAATTEAAAAELLGTILATAAAEGTGAEVGRLTGAHPWAIRTCVQAGIPLTPDGAMMTTPNAPPAPLYLPDGAFG
jgi:predicted N-acetyltransferase YhbS